VCCKKIYEANYSQINFIFFGFIKKIYKKKIRSHFGYVGSPGFQVDPVGYPGLTKLIASMGFEHLKPSQGPGSPRSRVNPPGRAEFYIYAPNQ
jgi:hypothetical protein